MLRKARLGCTEDGQIDVHRQLRVAGGGQLAMTRHHLELIDVRHRLGRHRRRLHCPAFSERGFPLVVTAPDLIDGIVKPRRRHHLRRPLRQAPLRLKALQAFGLVQLRVVMALRFGACAQQSLVQVGRAIGPHADLAPGALERL